MRILMWEHIRRESEGNAAFNMALLRAIDPRIITHRPRDPEKMRLMTELGMETSMQGMTEQREKPVRKKSTGRAKLPLGKCEKKAGLECEANGTD